MSFSIPDNEDAHWMNQNGIDMKSRLTLAFALVLGVNYCCPAPADKHVWSKNIKLL